MFGRWSMKEILVICFYFYFAFKGVKPEIPLALDGGMNGV